MTEMSRADPSHFQGLLRKVESLGIPPEAADWLLKALHPPAPVNSPGLPDETWLPLVRPDFKDATVIGAPAGATVTWDLCIWKVPGDNTVALWCSALPGTDFNTSGVIVGSDVGVLNCQQVENEAEAYASMALGTGNPAPGAGFFGVVVPATRPYSFRTQYSSITAYLTSSSLYNSGTVYAGQFPRGFTHRGNQADEANGLSPFGFPNGVHSMVTNVPFDEDSLMLMAPGAYTAPARDGAYLPMRLCGPTQEFVRRYSAAGELIRYRLVPEPPPAPPALYNHYWSIVDPWENLAPDVPKRQFGTYIPCAPVNTGPRDADAVGPRDTYLPVYWPDRAMREPANGKRYDTGYDNVSQGVIIFRGLDVHATVTLKTFTGLEIKTFVDSPARQFAKPPVAYNPRAMQAYYAIVQEMQSVYPASYNAFGSLIPLIGTVVSRLWPVVLRSLPVMAGMAGSAAAGYLGTSRGEPAGKPKQPPQARVYGSDYGRPVARVQYQERRSPSATRSVRSTRSQPRRELRALVKAPRRKRR